MADDVVFQAATPATPPVGTRISAEEVTNLNGGAVTAQIAQRFIPAVRTADATAVDVTTSNPLPVVQTGAPALPTGAATQATLADILAKIIAAPMTEATGASILAKIIASPATEATVAALLASLGATTDAAATGNGSAVAILKQLRTLYAGGLPAALVSGRLDVNVGASALPSGAATAANQSTANASLASIDTKLDALTTPSDTQPVSGTVAVSNFPAAQPVTDNGGSLTVDGSVSISGAVDVTPASPLATDYLPVRLTDGTDFYAVTGGGGGAGTEYTEGATDSTITGTAILWEDTSDTLRAVSATKPLPIGDAGGSITVDGTVAATQSGTWNVTNVSGTVSLPTGAATAANQSTANASLSSIDTKLDALTTPSDTQPISAVALPLPTGAATAAKQPALGTAGSASADVLSVQGVASMTPLLVNGSGVTQPVSGTFWQATQPVSAASLPLPSGAATAAKQPALGTAGTASADVLTVQGAASMTPILVDGSGATQPISDGGGSITVDGTVAVTGTFWQATQPVSGTVTANLAAGTNNIGDVDVLSLPALPAGNNNIGDVDVASLPALAAGSNLIGAVNVRPGTSGGLTIYRNLDVNATGASVKASAGQVFGWFIFNAAASTRYVKLYNVSSAPTVGTTTPVLTIPIPAGAAANVEFTNGIAFGTGIGIGATTALADNSTAAPTANDVIVNLLYA